jgi:hypothetical protein
MRYAIIVAVLAVLSGCSDHPQGWTKLGKWDRYYYAEKSDGALKKVHVAKESPEGLVEELTFIVDCDHNHVVGVGAPYKLGDYMDAAILACD